MIFSSQPPYPCVQNRTHSFEWNNPISMKFLKLFNLSAGVTNKFPLLWLLTRAQRQNRNLGIVLPFLPLSFFFYSTRSSLFEHFFLCFFLPSFSPFHAIVWQFSTCLCKKTNANRLKPTIYRCGKRNMQSFILARLYTKPSGFTGDCKKRTKWKKNVSKR